MDAHSPEMGVPWMMGSRKRGQLDLFVAGSLERLLPEDHVLVRVNRVLDLSWLREEVADCYCLDNGRPGIDPEVALRLMLAGMLLGYVHDRRLLREAQAHLGVRWFIGYGLHEDLPDHSSLTRIRQRWGAARFKAIFRRTVQACLEAGVAKAEVVHVDASLIRADVSWASLAERHADEVLRENPAEEEEGRKDKGRRGGGSGKVSRTDPDARLARKSARAGYEPSYKHHAAVDDERGVVLDVAVTEGTRNERAMLESHLEAVGELSGRAPALVTADSGYAYSKVYGASSSVAPAHGSLGGLPRRGEEPARTGAGGAPRYGQCEDPGLPDSDCGEPQAAGRRPCGAFIRPLEGLRRLETSSARAQRPLAPIGLALPSRVNRHITRFRNGVFQQPLEGVFFWEILGHVTKRGHDLVPRPLLLIRWPGKTREGSL